VQDFENSTFERRKVSECDRCALLSKAFVVNDLGEPDIDGHRKAHIQMIEADKVLQGYKLEATKKVIGWAVAALLGLSTSIVFSYAKDAFHEAQGTKVKP
jgi:hypothetical protein